MKEDSRRNRSHDVLSLPGDDWSSIFLATGSVMVIKIMRKNSLYYMSSVMVCCHRRLLKFLQITTITISIIRETLDH